MTTLAATSFLEECVGCGKRWLPVSSVNPALCAHCAKKRVKPRQANPKTPSWDSIAKCKPYVVSDSLQKRFNTWVDKALAQKVPESVVAFCFNLAMPYCVDQIVGSDHFDEKDPDWPCPPNAFDPKVEALDFPRSEDAHWEPILEAAKSLVSAYLDRPSSGSDRLRKATAVAVGYVDGDLYRIWPAKKPKGRLRRRRRGT